MPHVHWLVYDNSPITETFQHVLSNGQPVLRLGPPSAEMNQWLQVAREDPNNKELAMCILNDLSFNPYIPQFHLIAEEQITDLFWKQLAVGFGTWEDAFFPWLKEKGIYRPGLSFREFDETREKEVERVYNEALKKARNGNLLIRCLRDRPPLQKLRRRVALIEANESFFQSL